MEALLVSTGVVALAEIGDKTQLLALLLATKFKRPWPVVLGILVATLANHTFAGAVGTWLVGLVGAHTRCAGSWDCPSSPWPSGR